MKKIAIELTQEIKERLKNTFGEDQPLLVYKDKKQPLVFKPMDHELWKKIRKLVKKETIEGNLLPTEEVENLIFDECVVWPSITDEDKLDYQIGFIPQVVKNIQEVSGFLDVDVMDRPLRPTEHIEVLSDYEYWGDVTEEEVTSLKNEVPFPLFKITIDRWVFVVRPLTKGDVILLQTSSDEEMVGCKAVSVWPKQCGWDKLPGGIVKILWSSIMSISGFTEEAEVSEL